MMPLKNKITPHLWFDKEAKEAAKFYASVFPDSAVDSVAQIHNTPSGDCDIVSFHIADQPFMAISAGPYFTINPSVSFFVNFDPSRDPAARRNLDTIWEKLTDGGTALMPLDKYPFSEHYGWVQDKYGVSWQLILSNPGGDERPVIVPSLLFVGDNCGKAEEAMTLYRSVFAGSKQGTIFRYGKGQEPDKEGTVMFTDIMIGNRWIAAMDSAHDHQFAFNEAISLMIPCTSQEEIDYFWKKLSAVPESEQCGWCKDRYGLSWQIQPAVMNEMMKNGTPEQIDRLTKAFLPMKKFDIAALHKAYEGK